LSKCSECLNLQPVVFEEFLKLRSCNTKEELCYETIINWINFDQVNRETYFVALFDELNLNELPKIFLHSVVAENDLVLQNPAASKKLVMAMKKYLKSESSDVHPVTIKQQADVPSTSSSVCNSTVEQMIAQKIISQRQTGLFQNTAQSGNASRSSLHVKHDQLKSFHNELLIAGGITSPSYVRKFDVTTFQWNNLPDVPVNDGCVDGQLARYRKKFYLIGGRPSNGLNSFSDTWCFDPKESDEAWTACECMFEKRHRFGCTFYRNEIYVAGGLAHKTETLSTVESFSPNNGWTERAEMYEKRAGCCLVVHQGQLKVLGGQRGSWFYRTMESLHDNSFFSMWASEENGEMQQRRADFAAVNLNGCIYAIGGKSQSNKWLSSVEVFDDCSWKFVSPLNFPRSGHRACVLENKIYVAGGKNHLGPVKTIEMYIPENDLWTVIEVVKGDPVGLALVAM